MRRQWLGWIGLGLTLAAVGLGTLPGIIVTPPATAASELRAPGSLNVVVAPGKKLRTCPLEHTDVEAWSRPPTDGAREACQMGVNLIAYALQSAPVHSSRR
jgi:hypothetical protein